MIKTLACSKQGLISSSSFFHQYTAEASPGECLGMCPTYLQSHCDPCVWMDEYLLGRTWEFLGQKLSVSTAEKSLYLHNHYSYLMQQMKAWKVVIERSKEDCKTSADLEARRGKEKEKEEGGTTKDSNRMPQSPPAPQTSSRQHGLQFSRNDGRSQVHLIPGASPHIETDKIRQPRHCRIGAVPRPFSSSQLVAL